MTTNRWLVIGCIALFGSTAAEAYSGYNYKRVITIDHTKVSTGTASYANFPVLVSTTNVTFSTATIIGGHALDPSGFDIIFSTMNDCSFKLNWDTETYNSSTGDMKVWVKIPSISSTTDTTFNICYGNSSISSYVGFSTATWDTNYQGVWHFPNGTSLSAKDSTVNVNHGTISGPVATTGVIDGASSDTLTTDKITTTASTSEQITGDLTIEFWLFIRGTPSGFQAIIAKRDGGPGPDSYSVETSPNNGGLTNRIYLWFTQPTNSFVGYVSSDSNRYTLNGWDHWVFVRNNTARTVVMYKNGQSAGATLQAGTYTANPETSTSGTAIGNFSYANTNLAKNMDEMRISNVVRSADWVLTEYNNQNSPSTFFSVGAETTDVGATINFITNGIAP